ncbi:MAG TPA: hypothetical protein VIL99_17325 [Ignavibacteria bacterium]
MKLEKQQTAVFMTTVQSFKDFYELKCNLPELITAEDIEVRDDLYPEGVSDIFAVPFDHSIGMHLWFDTELGSYQVSVDIDFLNGSTTVTFDSDIHISEPIKNKQFTSKVEQLSEKDFNNLVDKCLPVIESFLDTLDRIERNKPCENDCYYCEQRKKDGGCDKMYISKSEYTPEENAWRQRITLAREQMKKYKYDI